MGKLQNISTRIINFISDTFYRIGYTIACNPWKIILLVLFVFGITCLGLLKFEIQRDPLELWVPKDSQFIKTTKWILKNLNTASRVQNVLVTAPNVLEPSVLNKLLIIHHEIEKIKSELNNGTQIQWSDVCMKIPFITQMENFTKRKKRSTNNETSQDSILDIFPFGSFMKRIQKGFEPSVDLPSIFYCNLINNLPKGCYEKNFVELFNYPKEIDKNVTVNDIINLLKQKEIVSPVTGHITDFSELLGGIEINENDEIISAKSMMVKWYININLADVGKQDMGNLAGTESWITEESAVWEEAFLRKMKELKLNLEDEHVKIYYNAEKSFGDISHAALFQESNKIGIGIVLMMLYVQVVLSKFSWIELRFGLTGMGLLSVGLAFISACGICSFLGIAYGPVHTSLPFLLMGLGVDDMFVLMACWRKVHNNKNSIKIEEKIALMVKHAGASITVTSLTDIIAFTVGSTTVIPSLQSFCLYAAVGVFMTYFYAITFFVAVFTLDEYRIDAKRNSLIPCIVHNEKNLILFCDFNLMDKFLKILYGKFILTKLGKIIVFITVIIVTGISSKCLLNIEQRFDPSWFIPDSTYLHDYLVQSKHYFPESGYEGSVFMGNLNYSAILPKIYNLTNEIENSEMFYKTKSWIKPFRKFVIKNYDIDIYNKTITDYDFKFYLSKFLFSANGGKYQANFNFETKLECGVETPNITVSWIDFRFKKFSHRDDYLPAMKYINFLITSKNFSESGDGFAQSWSKAYGNWITDEIIDREVYRNIILALVCVMFCTFIIIVDIQVCFWIFICVLLTLVNVGGFMQIWGLTIDLVSCIGLQLAVGLCVDYAAHIGHTFLVNADGNRGKRVLDTILHIGAAVLYGGGSTLLSLILLSQSEAYTFKCFFKIFFLIIFFGLFHGVVLLPVILSLVGSKPYEQNKRSIETINCVSTIPDEEMKPLKKSVITTKINDND